MIKVIEADSNILTRLFSMQAMLDIISTTFDFEPVKDHEYTVKNKEDNFKVVINGDGYTFNWVGKEYKVSPEECSVIIGDKKSDNYQSVHMAFADLAEILHFYEDFIVEDTFEGETETKEVLLDDLMTAVKVLKVADNIGIDLRDLS